MYSYIYLFHKSYDCMSSIGVVDLFEMFFKMFS